MFQRTLRNLSILNSVVLLFIFLAFGTIIYGYVSFRLFDNIDDGLRSKAEAIQIVNGKITQVKLRSLFDPRIFLVLRSENGQLIHLYPVKNEETDSLLALAAQARLGELKTQKVEQHAYRIISIPLVGSENVLSYPDSDVKIREVIAISNVDSEVGLLKKLFIIILGSMVIGIAGIVLTGYFLARRAMIPIQNAWNKQQQFVADASHELRSPLSVIKSNAELMLRHPDHYVEDESTRITNIIRESIRMTRLVSGLLTLARADANQSELQVATVQIDEIIDEVTSQFRELSEIQGILFTVVIQNNIVVKADKERLHQLLVILLDNAIKYTPAGGSICLSCHKADDNIVLSVEDTGYGIATEDLPFIFDRFFRGDKARSRGGGTGLGLAIAKWIVEKHGGKIKVEGQLGKGTSFIVTIPSKI